MRKPLDRLELEDKLCDAVKAALKAGDRAKLIAAVQELNELILERKIPERIQKAATA
jgi:hypothetical protein